MALSTLGLLVIGAIPTVIGIAEAIDAQKKQNQQAKEKIKFNLTAKFSLGRKSPVQEATVVFRDNKVRAAASRTPKPSQEGVIFKAASDTRQQPALSRSPGSSCFGIQIQRLLFWLSGAGEPSGSRIHGLGRSTSPALDLRQQGDW